MENSHQRHKVGQGPKQGTVPAPERALTVEDRRGQKVGSGNGWLDGPGEQSDLKGVKLGAVSRS